MVVGAPSGKLNMFRCKVTGRQLSETGSIFRELFSHLNKNTFYVRFTSTQSNIKK